MSLESEIARLCAFYGFELDRWLLKSVSVPACVLMGYSKKFHSLAFLTTNYNCLECLHSEYIHCKVKIITPNTTSNSRYHLGQIWNESIHDCWCYRAKTTVCYMSALFIANSWLMDLEDKSQDQKSLHMTHPLMLMIICAKYRKKSLFRTLAAAEQETTRYAISLLQTITKFWLIIEDLGEGQQSL